MKYAESLIPVFGEEMIKKVFSKPWAVREEGLKECEDYIKHRSNDLAVFQAGLNLSSQAMADKIQQIVQRGLSIL